MSIDFLYGFVFCMLMDVLFSIANFFIERAFYYRRLRKSLAPQGVKAD